MAQHKREKFIQGRKHAWNSNAKISEILVQGTRIKVTHADGVITSLPVKEGESVVIG